MNHKEDRAFMVWVVICALMGASVTGVIIWAVIELVNWVTTK